MKRAVRRPIGRLPRPLKGQPALQRDPTGGRIFNRVGNTDAAGADRHDLIIFLTAAGRLLPRRQKNFLSERLTNELPFVYT